MADQVERYRLTNVNGFVGKIVKDRTGGIVLWPDYEELEQKNEANRDWLRAQTDRAYQAEKDHETALEDRDGQKFRADKAEAQLEELAVEFEGRANTQFTPEGMKRLRKAIYKDAARLTRKRIADLKGGTDDRRS